MSDNQFVFYETPIVEVIEVSVEQGFNVSTQELNDFGYGGW